MTDLLKDVTAGSLLRTPAFGKPDATPQERRNYLCWGQHAPSAEYKLIMLALAALAFVMLALLPWSTDADAAPARPSHEQSVPAPATRVVLIAPLA